MIQNVYFKKKNRQNLNIFENWLIDNPESSGSHSQNQSNVSSCCLNSLALHSKPCHCFRTSQKYSSESSFPVFIQSLIYQPMQLK